MAQGAVLMRQGSHRNQGPERGGGAGYLRSTKWRAGGRRRSQLFVHLLLERPLRVGHDLAGQLGAPAAPQCPRPQRSTSSFNFSSGIRRIFFRGSIAISALVDLALALLASKYPDDPIERVGHHPREPCDHDRVPCRAHRLGGADHSATSQVGGQVRR